MRLKEFLTAAMLVAAGPSAASVVVDIYENDDHVLMRYSGSPNIEGMDYTRSYSASVSVGTFFSERHEFIDPSRGFSRWQWDGITGGGISFPIPSRRGGANSRGISSGDPFCVSELYQFICLPLIDEYNGFVEGSVRFDGSFDSLGFVPGTYQASLPNDVVTYNFIDSPSPAPVPLPATSMLLITALASAAAFRRRAGRKPAC